MHPNTLCPSLSIQYFYLHAKSSTWKVVARSKVSSICAYHPDAQAVSVAPKDSAMAWCSGPSLLRVLPLAKLAMKHALPSPTPIFMTITRDPEMGLIRTRNKTQKTVAHPAVVGICLPFRPQIRWSQINFVFRIMKPALRQVRFEHNRWNPVCFPT